MALLILLLAIAIVIFTGGMPQQKQVIIAALLLIAAIVSIVVVFGRTMTGTVAMLIVGLAATGGLSGALILLRVFVVYRKRNENEQEPKNRERSA